MNAKTEPPRKTYIWQQPDWPALSVDAERLTAALGQARLEQGRLLGQLESIGLQQALEISSELWVQDTIATAAIEGESLSLESVRSSVANRLGLLTTGATNQDVEGLVELMQDASSNYHLPLTHERLHSWQAELFSNNTKSGRAGIRKIAVGRYRDHADEMQIISGVVGREIVHYRAPASVDVPRQMELFLQWFQQPRVATEGSERNNIPLMGGLVRAAIAHLWFESIHPFEDGNGRVGRAILDLALAQDIGAAIRIFSLSKQLQVSRAQYYNALNAAQCGGLNVTDWVLWFITAFTEGCLRSQKVIASAQQKSSFWNHANTFPINDRQRKVLARLVEAGRGGFLGGLDAAKYCKMTNTSKASATRDLVQLLKWGLLTSDGIGKATRYDVIEFNSASLLTNPLPARSSKKYLP